MISDIDETGFTPDELSAWSWYKAVVNDLIDREISFYEARLLIDAYVAWIEIFDPAGAKYYAAQFRRNVSRRLNVIPIRA